jgi:hypothetical protein
MNSYPLYGENRSPFCWGYLDNNKKKFLDNNSADIIDCCIDSCRNRITYCFETCKNTYGQGKSKNYFSNRRCNEQCRELIKDCQSGCLEVSSQGLKIVGDCAKQSGCGEYPVFNNECLYRKKDSIIDCCNTSCVTNQSVDCQGNFCSDFYDQLAKGVGSSLYDIENNYKLDGGNFKGKNRNYFFVILGVALAILVVYILVKEK